VWYPFSCVQASFPPSENVNGIHKGMVHACSIA